MKKLACWIIVSAAGLALMSFSHFCCRRVPVATDSSQKGIIYVGKTEPNSQAGEFEYTKGTVRLLSLSVRGEHFKLTARAIGQRIENAYCIYFAEKLFFYPEITTDVNSAMLVRGRLPCPGANEVVAGYHARQKEKLDINGQQLQVVGILKPQVHLFSESYLVYDKTQAAELLDYNDESVRDAYILPLSQKNIQNLQIRRQVTDMFPESEFVLYFPRLQVEPQVFYPYMLGMSLLLIGGVLTLVNVFHLLAGRARHKWLSLPLAEVVKYRRLFLSVHLLYFVLFLLFVLAIYAAPEIQFCLLAHIKAQATEGSGPLAVASEAYMSKNILRAAVTTFAINFPLGSLICVTVPSVILPGTGALVAGIRAVLWGSLLSPAFDPLPRLMLSHSVTLLLEGEGYVLAAFFALLIPVYLFRKAEGPNFLRRYGRVLLINLAGNILVAAVLAIAAIYEAIEVILVAL